MLSQTGQEWPGYRNGDIPVPLPGSNSDIPVPLPGSNGDIPVPSTRLPLGPQARQSGGDRRSPAPIGEEPPGRDCVGAGSACQGRCEAASKESAASSRSAQAPWIRETSQAREAEQDKAREPVVLPRPFKTNQEPAHERHGGNGPGCGRSRERFGVHEVLFAQDSAFARRHASPAQPTLGQDLNSG
jgi:hypothetical protein